jgi:hypothetical protein
MTVKLIGIKSDLSLMQILGQAISETENHAFEHHPTPSSPTSHKYCASQMYSQRSLAMAEYHGDLFSRPNPKHSRGATLTFLNVTRQVVNPLR